MKITANFNNITGKIKPMHAVGQPPMAWNGDEMFHYLTEANIPYSRLHDVDGWFGRNLYVDIPNIFRDFDADETKEESYDFAFTDCLIKYLHDSGVKPFYRLGVTIENAYMVKAYRIHPPKDFAKWARICEHIIRHYNEGWANGFAYGIEYWEIWNEPDGPSNVFNDMPHSMWTGTREQYFELYETTAKHLKACFGDSIKVGGYASCGFYSKNKEGALDGLYQDEPYTDTGWYINYMHRFLTHLKKTDTPLDFFSWHSYEGLSEMLKSAEFCRSMLDKCGFESTPHFLNEWNIDHSRKNIDTSIPAAKALALMLGMQKRPVDMLCYYDAEISISVYGGMFNPCTFEPRKTYYAFRSFGRMYAYQNEIETESDCADIYVGGAAHGSKGVLVIANPTEKTVTAELDITGMSLCGADVIITDKSYLYTDSGKNIENGKITLTPYSCTEIRFYK